MANLKQLGISDNENEEANALSTTKHNSSLFEDSLVRAIKKSGIHRSNITDDQNKIQNYNFKVPRKLKQEAENAFETQFLYQLRFRNNIAQNIISKDQKRAASIPKKKSDISYRIDDNLKFKIDIRQKQRIQELVEATGMKEDVMNLSYKQNLPRNLKDALTLENFSPKGLTSVSSLKKLPSQFVQAVQTPERKVLNNQNLPKRQDAQNLSK